MHCLSKFYLGLSIDLKSWYDEFEGSYCKSQQTYRTWQYLWLDDSVICYVWFVANLAVFMLNTLHSFIIFGFLLCLFHLKYNLLFFKFWRHFEIKLQFVSWFCWWYLRFSTRSYFYTHVVFICTHLHTKTDKHPWILF